MLPRGRKPGYGWFELGAPILNEEAQLFEVRRFWEKPPAETTRAIWNAGAHRNSFILVAKVSALLSLILKTLPRLHAAFHSVRPVLGTMFEGRTMSRFIGICRGWNFPSGCWPARPQSLAVLAVSNIEWSDLGDPQRVLNLLKRIAQTRQREQLASAIRFSTGERAAPHRPADSPAVTRDRDHQPRKCGITFLANSSRCSYIFFGA